MIDALTLSPQRQQIGSYFDMQDDNIRTADVCSSFVDCVTISSFNDCVGLQRIDGIQSTCPTAQAGAVKSPRDGKPHALGKLHF